MATPHPHPLARWLLGRRRSSRQGGFTLTELLVSLIVGTLVMGSLLYLVVELLGMNAREERLTQVQQDTRRALDYMSRDVREAIFVYADPDVVADQLTNAPADSTAVLAFWRLRDIEDQINAVEKTNATFKNCSYTAQADKDLCGILKLRRSVYDLVVYFVRENDAGGIWSGPSRLIRYELTAFSNLGNLTYTTGYVDPSLPENDFATWTKAGGTSGTTAGRMAVLTDGIDAHNASVDAACPTGYVPFPEEDSNHVFVCTNPTATGADQNKTIYLFLRGSIVQNDGSGGVIFGPVGEGSRLPTLNTEVQVRGVLERQI